MHRTELAGQFPRDYRLSSGWQAAKDDEHTGDQYIPLR
jgi:hypothetical protein